MKTNPNEYALNQYFDQVDGQFKNSGLTKREYFAAMAMQGFCSNPRADGPQDEYADSAIKMADALIAELNKEEK